MATTSEPQSRQSSLVIRNRRLHFVSDQTRPNHAWLGAPVLAIAGIATVVLLRSWLHTRTAKRYYTLNMCRLRENRLVTARDVI